VPHLPDTIDGSFLYREFAGITLGVSAMGWTICPISGESRKIRGGFEPACELAHSAYKEIEEAARIRGPFSRLDTGFADLNRMTGSLHNQNLVVVAARPGLGKTSFCLKIACHAAVTNRKPVRIFILEMSKPETAIWKQRTGMTGTFLLTFLKRTKKFESFYRDAD
jgi:replicative DNA helicase